MRRHVTVGLLCWMLLGLFAASCAEDPDERERPVLQVREGPALIEDLPRLSGDYPPELIDGLSKQLVDEVNCIQPGVLAEFEIRQEPGYLWTDNYIPHLLRPEVIDAAEAVCALAGDYMTITSGYRDVGMQYYDWLWGQRLGFLAARPGSSRHQAGQAIDVRFHDTWRPRLLDYGWEWPYGTDDRPHFEWRENNTPNLMVESVRAFQRLWNRNNPTDVIAEDGIWGMQSESRIAQTDAAGFAIGGCDLDGDGHASPTIGGGDCDDTMASVHPGATEICGDNIDQDCANGDLVCGMEPEDTAMEPDMAADTATDTVADNAPTDTTADTVGDALSDMGPDTVADNGLPDTGNPNSFTAWSQVGERDGVETETACGCRTRSTATTPRAAWWGVLVLLLFWGTRRRRTVQGVDIEAS